MDRLEAVILYGSYARGDFHDESDADFLVVLRDDKIHAFTEITSMIQVLLPIGLQHGITISVHPTTVEKLEGGGFSFFENIRREGFAL